MWLLLFFSGRSFVGSISPDMETVKNIFPITWRATTAAGASGGGSNNPTGSTVKSSSSASTAAVGGKHGGAQPLVGWCEVVSHPGLVCAMTQWSSNPVILMLKPDTIFVQEVKITQTKTKVRKSLSTFWF